MVDLSVLLLLVALSWHQACGLRATFYGGLLPRSRRSTPLLQENKLKFMFSTNGRSRLRLFGCADGTEESLPPENDSQLHSLGSQQASYNGSGRKQPAVISIYGADSEQVGNKITFTSAERVAAKDLAAKGRRASKRSLARALQGESDGMDLSDPPPIEEFRRLMESLGDESVDLFLDDILQPAGGVGGSKIGDPGTDQLKQAARSKADRASRASKKSKTGAVDAGRAREASVLSENRGMANVARLRPAESWADRNPDALDRGVSMEVLKAGEEDFYVDMDEIDSMLDRMSTQGLDGFGSLGLDDDLNLLAGAAGPLGDLGDFSGLGLGLGDDDLFLEDEGPAFMQAGSGDALLGTASAAPTGKGGKGKGPLSGGGSKRKKQATMSLLDLGHLDQDLLDGTDASREELEGYDNDDEDDEIGAGDGDDGDEGEDLLMFDPDSDDDAEEFDEEEGEEEMEDEDDVDYSSDDVGIGMEQVAKRGVGALATAAASASGRRRAQRGEDGEDIDIDSENDSDIDLEGGATGERGALRISAPTAKRASRLNRADDGNEGGEEVRSGAEKLWLPNVYSGGRPKTAPVPIAQYLAASRHRTTPDSAELAAEVAAGTADQVIDEAQVEDEPGFLDDWEYGELEAGGDDGAGEQGQEGSSALQLRVEELIAQGKVVPEEVEHKLYAHDEPAPWRVQIVSVVTTSSRNSTALEYVQKVYDHIKAGTNNDERITYQIQCFTGEDGGGGEQPFEELEDMVQMWLESYNTYHLVDGAAMKEAWGAIMPHIMLSPKNLQAILDQVLWALAEDGMDGALLTPRLRRLRFRGGAQEMSTGFNTQHLDSEFSTVSVR